MNRLQSAGVASSSLMIPLQAEEGLIAAAAQADTGSPARMTSSLTLPEASLISGATVGSRAREGSSLRVYLEILTDRSGRPSTY